MAIKRNIRVLYAISLLQGMIFYGPIATLYREAAGVSIFQITLIEGISMALCLALELPWGILADRIGYKSTLIWCCLLYFASKLVFWQADGFGAFLLERVMLSVVISGISGVDASVLYLSSGEAQSQRVFGVYNNLGTAGLIFAAGIYSVFIKDDYRLAGLLTVFAYAAAALLAFFLVEVARPQQRRGKPLGEFRLILAGLLRDKKLLALLISVALLNETHQTITVFLNQPQYVRGGLSNQMIGYVYAAITAIGLIGGYSARLTERLGAPRLGAMLFGACALACATLALTGNAALSVLCVALLRIGFSLFQPLQMQLQNRQVESGDRATALSVNALLIDGVAIATNLIFGRLAELRLPLAMGLGALLCLCGLALFLASTTRGRG